MNSLSYSSFSKKVATLPCELKHKILGYTMQPQNPTLCADIVSFVSTYHKCRELYYNVYIINLGENVNEDIYWFANDLVSYTNDFYATGIYGYREEFFEIWRRNWSMRLWPNNRIQAYLKNIEPKNTDKIMVGQLFGLLTQEEREFFTNSRYDNYL